jgi:8-oxo-dGTP diphosphatase
VAHRRAGPAPTADVIIEIPARGIVLIERRFPPPGWALPGGFIEVGETAAEAAVREAKEETGLEVALVELFHVYADPARDPRRHTLSVVYIGRATGEPRGGDDAARAAVFAADALPSPLAFDHARILADYLAYRRTGVRPPPA